MTGRKRGGQPGNRNAVKTGFYTRAATQARRRHRRLLAEIDRFLAELKISAAQRDRESRREI